MPSQYGDDAMKMRQAQARARRNAVAQTSEFLLLDEQPGSLTGLAPVQGGPRPEAEESRGAPAARRR